MLLCKAISLRSLIAKEMSRDFSQNTHIACTHPYTHRPKREREREREREWVTGLLKAIMHPVNSIFAATTFIQIVIADFFRGGGRAILLGIYKRSRKLADELNNGNCSWTLEGKGSVNKEVPPLKGKIQKWLIEHIRIAFTFRTKGLFHFSK